MTLALANRKDAIRDRISTCFAAMPGFGYFDVKLSRRAKHQSRVIEVSWVVFPFEETVIEALGDLMADDVILSRRQVWTCGRFHADEMEAWKEHEGADYLVYPDDDHSCSFHLADKVLPEEVEDDLRAAGETFESGCRPGNHLPCPTCGGGSRILDPKTHKFTPCPACVQFGLDSRLYFPGIFDLDVPEQRAFYEAQIAEVQAQAQAEAQRVQVKRDKALSEPTTFATPHWKALPTRNAGILAGQPVAERVGCDHLTNADDPERRVLCGNDARWFDTNTGLRVCSRHRDHEAKMQA